MKMSLTERAIIANQLKILEKLYPEDAKNYAIYRTAIENGYEMHYFDFFEGSLEEMSKEECLEVIDILDMYRALTFSYQKLTDKTGIDENEIHFDGFDGNEEPRQYWYARYFILDLDRFKELTYGQEYPDLNSHCNKLETYRGMLSVWKSIEDRFNLNADQMRRILDA